MALLKRSAPLPDLPAQNAAIPSREMLAARMRTGATPTARRGAVQDLASYFAADRELVASLLEEPDVVVRAAILAGLVFVGTEVAAAGVAAAVCAEEASLRNAAVDALREFGEKARPQIEQLLASPHPEQRIVAVGLLEALRDAGARDLLRETLATDPDINVGLAAVEALSLVVDPGDEAALRSFESRFAGNAFVTFAVRSACQRLATGEAS